jgi:hypothetical protein
MCFVFARGARVAVGGDDNVLGDETALVVGPAQPSLEDWVTPPRRRQYTVVGLSGGLPEVVMARKMFHVLPTEDTE